MLLPVVNLLVVDRLALSGVAHADAGHATQRLARDVPGALRLAKSAVHAPHELTSNHTHFVEDKQERLFESVLEVAEPVTVEFLKGPAKVAVVDQAVDRRRVEAEVEGRGPRRSRHFHEVRRKPTPREESP